MNVTSHNEPEPPLAKVLGKRALVYLGILVFALALLLILNTGNASAAGPTYVWNDITTDTTWDEANSPYIVNQSIAIDPGVTLTIEPNVTVMFDDSILLTVSGALDAQGTADEPVTFTSNGSTVWGAWDGLYFNEISTGSVLDYVVIEYAYDAVQVYNSDVALSNAEISWSDEAAVYWFVDDGDLEASMSNVVVNGSDWLGILFYNVDGSNDLTLSNIEVVNAEYGIICDANVNAVLIYTEIYTATIWSDALWIGATFGDVDALIDAATLEHTSDNAIFVEADEGAVTLIFIDLWIDFTDEEGIYVWANQSVDIFISEAFVNDTWWQSMSVFSANGDIIAGLLFVEMGITYAAYDAIDLIAATGDIYLTMTNCVISDASGTGINAWAPNGDIFVLIDPTEITNCFTGIIVDAGGDANVYLWEVTIADCINGAVIYGDLNVTVEMIDVTIDGCENYALRADANLGDVLLTMTGGLVNDTGGIYMQSFDGDVIAVFYQATFAFNDDVSIDAYAMQYDVDLLIDECLFDGDFDDSVVVEAEGDVSLEITDNVMDGSEAGATSWYFFDEMEYEFDIIDPVEWSETTGFWYELSFDFPIGGSTYSDIWVDPSGYILVGGEMIVPCQDALIADGYPGVGVKEYADRVVIQWDVFNDYDDSYLRNVFEVVLYDNGDIQFNYAEMESVYHNTNWYGMTCWGWTIDLRQLYNYDVFDNDFSSVYLTYAPVSDGWAVQVTSGNNCTALVTGNEVSNYAAGGMGFLAEEGWMWLDATNNSFSYILGYDYGAITAMAWNNTIWANVENNVFSFIPSIGVVLMSAPSLGGEDVFNVVENEFWEVGFVSIATISSIWDGYDEGEVTYVSTRTITDNIGVNSGCVIAATMIDSEDSAWNITLDDIITGNEFTGTPKYYSPITGFALQPEYTGISAILEIELATGNSTVVHNAVITDNLVPQNIFGLGIIAIDDISLESGNVESTSEFTITDNTIDTGPFYYEVGIMSDVTIDFMDGNVVSTVLIDIQRNTILNNNWGELGIIVGAGLDEWGFSGEQYTGDATMDIEIWIWDNTLENFSLGIGGEFGFDLDDSWGDFVVNLAASIMFNDISATYEGIMFEVWSECEFHDYFSPFETEITSSVTTNIDFIIEENVVETWSSGIGVRIQSWAAEDAYGVFTNALVDTNAVVNINDNTVLEAEGMIMPDGFGIGVENSVEAFGGEAQATSSVDVVIEGNTVSLYDADPGIGVRAYVGAYTNEMELDDAPTATSEMTATIAFNTVENAYNGIALGQESYAVYGMSFADSTFTALVFDNTVTGATYHGIYADCEAYTDQDYGYGAVASLITDVTIEDNLVDEVWDEGIYVDFQADSYIVIDSTFDILDNTLIGAEEMVMDGCDGVTVDGGYVAAFNIIGNVIDNFEGGIWAWDASVLIEGNAITNADYGIDLENVWGVVDSNVMTDVYNAFYLYECGDLVVVDNVATTSFGYDSWDGVDVYYCWNLTFEGNYIEGFSYGMYIYDTWESVFTENSVIDSVWDSVEIEYCYWIEFSYNTLVGAQGDGLWVYYSDFVTIEGNTISDHMDDGIDLYECDNAVVSNNVVTNIGDNGLEVDYCDDLVLYNGVFADCADYGIDAYYYGMVWIVDGVAEVRNCPVYFAGDVTIVDGGILTTDFVSSFYMDYDWYDGVPALTVEEGGALVATNTAFGGWWEDLNGDAWLFDVYGTLTMDNSWIYGAYQLYCGPTSDVEIHASVIAWNYLNGVYIDDCSPIIASTEITDNEKDGVYITGENAEPSIKDCTIAFNERGIYAYEASLGQVIDNLIFFNYMAGIYVDTVVGEIHDNILLFNQREIFVKNSVLSIEDNQIGYSMYVELMAEYWPILMGEMGMSESPMQWFFDPEDIMSMMSNHIGIYVDGSVVECSGNVYGMLSYALYAVDSEVLFADSVEMNTLIITYFDEWYTMYNISLPIFVFDGIFASDSMIDVVDAYIEVMDDAVFLEACEAWIENSEFVAGDFDIYAMDNTTADVLSTDVDKVKAEDTSTINMWYMLTIYTVNPDGNPVDVPVLVFNAVDMFPIYEGNSSGGVFAVPVIAGQWTSSGEDTSMNPYTAYASFEGGNVDQTVTVDGPTEVTLQDPGPPTIEVSLGFVVALVVVAGILVFVGILTLAARP